MIAAILLAGGIGSRIKSAIPKQFLDLQGKPCILYALATLLSCPDIHEIVVVCEEMYQPFFPKIDKPLFFALPGKTRQQSVYHGLQALSQKTKYVCIHDGARPLLDPIDLDAVLKAGLEHGAATLAVPVKTTIKESNDKGFVKKTFDRSNLWDIQTPQVLAYRLLIEGFQKVHQENLLVTDDVSLAELLGHPVKLVTGSYTNIKITTPEDLVVADVLLRNAGAKI